MKRKCLAQQDCPLARGYDAIGDWWSLLIVSQIVLGGQTRFSQLQGSLGMAKNILTARLKKLVEEGILEKRPCPAGSAYSEYVATDVGKDLFKVLVALRAWGARHFGQGCSERVELVDAATQRPVVDVEVRNADGKVLGVEDLALRTRSD